MPLIDQLVNPSAPRSVYLWERTAGNFNQTEARAAIIGARLDFQYWPESLQDDYQVEYAEHMIPGGSHPLYQWVGGRGRTISFQAVFTSEVNTEHLLLGNVAPVQLTPSSIYTVNIDGALNLLRGWMRPLYGTSGDADGSAAPPKKLVLALPKTRLNGTTVPMNVILRSCPITYEAWFPDGQPRVATVDLTFSEIVQSNSTGSGATVKFIDSTKFARDGKNYNFKSANNLPLIGGS